MVSLFFYSSWSIFRILEKGLLAFCLIPILLLVITFFLSFWPVSRVELAVWAIACVRRQQVLEMILMVWHLWIVLCSSYWCVFFLGGLFGYPSSFATCSLESSPCWPTDLLSSRRLRSIKGCDGVATVPPGMIWWSSRRKLLLASGGGFTVQRLLNGFKKSSKSRHVQALHFGSLLKAQQAEPKRKEIVLVVVLEEFIIPSPSQIPKPPKADCYI